MAEQPTKADINAIFKRLRSNQTNKQCFDCGHSHPTWASVTYGVFLCIDCSAVHRSLGVHVTFIRSTQLDTSWTWLQLRAMQVGGNANAISFFRQHGCDTTDSQKKYHSRAAHLYKEKLLTHAQQACRLHGTKLHIDVGHTELSPEAKEVDFFKEHAEFEPKPTAPSPIVEAAKLSSGPQPINNGSMAGKAAEDFDPNEGPNVEAALSMSPTQAAAIAEPRKAIIGGKKAPAGRKGKGFGAQRVKANFSEIENRAQQLDKEREDLAKANAVKEAKTKEEQEKQMATMRLAYQDMSLQRQKQEDKLKAADPKKAEQFERLGMGFAGSKGISHSAISDMQTIQQEGVKDKNDRNSRRRDFFDDELEMMGGGRFSSSSSSSRYSDRYEDSSYGSKRGDDFGSWGNPNKGGSWDIDRFDSKSSSSKDNDSPRDKEEEDGSDDDNGSMKTTSKKTYTESSTPSAASSDTQKRFSNAKAISSDQYFGNTSSDFEHRQTMSRLEGKSAISSDDYFGTGGGSSRSGNSSYSASPDLQDIRDGVKQGVTKVAGKISSLANGVLNTLQDRYGS